MTEDLPPHPALLPVGLRDILPPEAEREASSVASVMDVFAMHGYQRVKPPLLDFADSLLTGPGAAVASETFRLLDPEGERMLGLRADMTPQVARIAATRFRDVPRPLRLSYAGQCLRARGGQLAPDRQIGEAGIELIGSDAPEADAEVIVVCAEALAAIGLGEASFDLTLPALAPLLGDAAGIDAAESRKLVHALDRKDTAAVARHGGALADVMTRLLLAAGPADRALRALAESALPPAAERLATELRAVVAAVRALRPSLNITIDPLEFRGFLYHTGVCMAVFTPGHAEELGRGGRYLTPDHESATGVTLYSDALLRAAPRLPTRPRVFLPDGADRAVAERLRAQGYATLAALGADEGLAARLGCTHVLKGARAVAIERTKV